MYAILKVYSLAFSLPGGIYDSFLFFIFYFIFYFFLKQSAWRESRGRPSNRRWHIGMLVTAKLLSYPRERVILPVKR